MGDADKRQCAFTRGLAAQINATVFRHDVFHVHAGIRGHLHAGTIPEIVPLFRRILIR